MQPPSDEILDAFGVGGAPEPVAGGEERSWRAADLVFKPCDDEIEWAWLGQHLPSVREDGFRLALPAQTLDGRWTVDGWCATTWLMGVPADDRWIDVLDVAARLHPAMRHLPRPAFVDARTHAWSIGDRVAWDEAPAPERIKLLERLMAARRPVGLTAQVIHGDLTDNVLFADGMEPAVIDPTPYWRPAGFASAVVVEDAVRWHGADPQMLLPAVASIEGFPQLLVRAVIFRLVTAILGERAEIDAFAEVAELAIRLVQKQAP